MNYRKSDIFMLTASLSGKYFKGLSCSIPKFSHVGMKPLDIFFTAVKGRLQSHGNGVNEQ